MSTAADGVLNGGGEASVRTPGNAPLQFKRPFEIREDQRTTFVADFTPGGARRTGTSCNRSRGVRVEDKDIEDDDTDGGTDDTDDGTTNTNDDTESTDDGANSTDNTGSGEP